MDSLDIALHMRLHDLVLAWVAEGRPSGPADAAGKEERPGTGVRDAQGAPGLASDQTAA